MMQHLLTFLAAFAAIVCFMAALVLIGYLFSVGKPLLGALALAVLVAALITVAASGK